MTLSMVEREGERLRAYFGGGIWPIVKLRWPFGDRTLCEQRCTKSGSVLTPRTGAKQIAKVAIPSVGS